MNGLLSGMISGVLASVLFLLFMLFIKPRIVISDNISVDKNGVYRIKIVNKSLCMLSNLKYDLRLCYDHGDGIVDIDSIKPAKPPLESIARYSRRDKSSMYALRISYIINGGKCIIGDDGYYLEFTVSAKHTLSNTYKVVTKVFQCSDIKFGIFETGANTNLIRDTDMDCASAAICVRNKS